MKNRIVKFKNLGIEVDFKQEQNGKKLKDIKIRKGWRLLRFEELKEIMNYIINNDLDIWSYVEQPIEKFKGKYVARFFADSDRAVLCCSWFPTYSGAALGVIFCRALKNVKEK